MGSTLIRRGDKDTGEQNADDHVKIQGEDGTYKPRQEASEGTHAANTLILDS